MFSLFMFYTSEFICIIIVKLINNQYTTITTIDPKYYEIIVNQ